MRSLVLVFVLAGCGGGDEHDASGTYSINITRGMNGCGFPNWNSGEQFMQIEFIVVQTETSLTGEVGGLLGTYLELVIGNDTFAGTVEGRTFDMLLPSTKDLMMNQCTYRVNARMRGQTEGDAMAGTIEYTTTTNMNADCGAMVEGCTSEDAFNGVRPPTAE